MVGLILYDFASKVSVAFAGKSDTKAACSERSAKLSLG
jgi:hypothetical protein